MHYIIKHWFQLRWESFRCQSISMKHTMKMPCFGIHLVHFSSKPWSMVKHCWCSISCACHTIFQDSPSLSNNNETSPLVVKFKVWQNKNSLLKSWPLTYHANTRSWAQAATSVNSSSWIANFPKDASFISAITCCLTPSDISTIHWLSLIHI